MQEANTGLLEQRSQVNAIADSNARIGRDIKKSQELLGGIERGLYMKYILMYAVIALLALIIFIKLVSKILFFL
jgi:hypothetical protein